jgi:hypothetical protein
VTGVLLVANFVVSLSRFRRLFAADLENDVESARQVAVA